VVVVTVVVVVVVAAVVVAVAVVVVVKCTAVPGRIGRQTATQYGYCAKFKIKSNTSKPGNVL
jgi:hypothetical protein